MGLENRGPKKAIGTNMKYKEIGINVSEKIGQPEFSSVMLSASVTMTVEDDAEVKGSFREAWATAWEEIGEQKEALKDKKVIKEAVDEGEKAPVVPPPVQAPVESEDPIMTSTTPRCPVHGDTVTYRPSGVSKKTGKAYTGFYSCSFRMPDGSFCKEKFK